MDAGRLDKRVTIQTRSEARNAIGESVPIWSDVATVWASVEPIQGREFWAQQQVQSEVTTRVRIRYRTGITSKNRVLYGSRILVIDSVIDPKERHEELQLMCTEGAADD